MNGAIETLQDVADRKKSERALQKSERRLRALLDFEPYPVVVFTLDGLVNYVNPAFTEIFGWTLEETASVIGHQTHHEHQVANQLSESLRNVRSLLEEGRRLMGDSQARLDRDGMLKVYIRDPADYELIRRTLDAEAPAGIPRIYLQGDICRANLLTEIDGIVACEKIAAPSP